MQLAFDFNAPPTTASVNAAAVRARAQGAQRHYSGLAAEDAVLRDYERRGAKCLKRRYRCPHGELDLVLLHDGLVVFAEVKRCKSGLSWDSPVSPAQWQRLENAAEHFLAEHQASLGTPFCRFDVAVVWQDGTIEIFDNPR